MAGHSEWHNRKHRKRKQDKKKGKIFSKMARRISVAAREGGGDPEKNPTLRMYIDKAKSYEVPKENIERAIKRGTGELEGVEYEEFVYEGYGPAGVALLLDIVTDNRNRTASELRHLLSKHGGNLGEEGCVAWMFDRKGVLSVQERADLDKEELFLDAIEAGAEDIVENETNMQIFTKPGDFLSVKTTLEESGYDFERAELTMLPRSEVRVEGREAERLLRLLEALDEHEDVQEVYSNFDIPQEQMAEFTD